MRAGGGSVPSKMSSPGGGGDPPPEEEDPQEDEFPFLKADQFGFERIQKAFQAQLTGQNERVTLQLREKKEELKKLTSHREEIGVTLYGAQQQLAKLQVQLDEMHDKFAMVHTGRMQDRPGLAPLPLPALPPCVNASPARRQLCVCVSLGERSSSPWQAPCACR